MSQSIDIRSPSRGAILVMTLGMIALLSWLVVQICAKVSSQLTHTGYQSQNELLRTTAYQALDLTLAVLAEFKEIEGGLYGPAQGWDSPLLFAGVLVSGDDQLEAIRSRAGAAALAQEGDSPAGAVDAVSGAASSGESSSTQTEQVPIVFPQGIELTITIDDESGKFPLKNVTAERLNLYFEEEGWDESERNLLTDSLLDWMDADHSTRPFGAESDYYQQREPPYNAANKHLSTFAELRLIRGFDLLFFDDRGAPNEHYHQFVRSFSLHYEGALNLNTADPLTVQTYAQERGFALGSIERFLTIPTDPLAATPGRILSPRTRRSDLPLDKNGNPPDTSVTVGNLQITIVAVSANTRFILTALIDTTTTDPDGLYPFTFLDLRENMSLPSEMPL